MEKLSKKKICLIVLAIVIIVAAYWYYSSTQWERDFEIRYVDYVSDKNNKDYNYYLYEITNKTNHTLTDVYAVISVETIYGDFEYEDSVSHRIKPGETVEYKLYNKDYNREAENRGMELGAFSVYSVDIVKIKYSK